MFNYYFYTFKCVLTRMCCRSLKQHIKTPNCFIYELFQRVHNLGLKPINRVLSADVWHMHAHAYTCLYAFLYECVCVHTHTYIHKLIRTYFYSEYVSIMKTKNYFQPALNQSVTQSLTQANVPDKCLQNNLVTSEFPLLKHFIQQKTKCSS